MATIPLQLAQRQLDTGAMVSYPNGSPVGEAMQGFGDELSAVAERYRERKEQQEAFDAEVVRRRLDGQIAQAENDAAASAPADGNGLHDAMYGQVDPRTGQVIKSGLFDELFDSTLPKVPVSQRANFFKQKEVLRSAGSVRIAARQYQRRKDYERSELNTVLKTNLNSVAQIDPDDTGTFEATRQDGADFIGKTDLDPQIRLQLTKDWHANMAYARAQALIAKDPRRAAEMLGAAPVAKSTLDTVVDKIIGVESGGNAAAKNPNSSASGVGQFLDSTWVQTVKVHRPDLAAGKSAAEIIALKGDATLGRQMTEALTRDNAEYLANRGVAITSGNLYLAHFLGSAGAVNVLKADPNASIASVVGQDVVRANPFLAGKSIADTVAWSDKKMGGGASARGERVGRLTPDERVAQAFQNDSPAQPGGEAAWVAAPWIAELSPDAVQDLGQKARMAMTAQLIDARTNIALASQNAPAAIANTGVYSGQMPGPEAFTAVYGAEEGGKRFQDFSRRIDVGRQAFGMRTMPNQALHASLRDAEPGPGRSQEDQSRYQVAAAAAIQTLDARRADPAGYVRQVFPNVDAAWNKVTRPDSEAWNRRGVPDSYDPGAYGDAIAASVAAQKQMGIENFQPLPQSVVQNIVETFSDKGVPQADKDSILRSLFAGASDPGVRTALSQQLAQAGLPELTRSAPTRSAAAPAAAREAGQQPASVRSGKGQSVLGEAVEDFGNYVSESFEALGRIPHDVGQFVRDLRSDPLDAVIGLSNSIPNPASGPTIEGAVVAGMLGRILRDGLAAVRGNVAGKVGKPLEEALSKGSSELAADVATVPEARTGTALYRYWPPNDGFVGAPVRETLPVGTRIDRYGLETGYFVSPEGTPAWMRSMQPGATSRPYNVYEVVKPIDVLSGKIAAWFGQPGGGMQHEFFVEVKNAVETGYLKRIEP